MLDRKTFNEWLSDFFTEKSNQLQYSRVSSPKRMQKITLDLSVAQSSPLKFPFPCKSIVMNRIYSTATPTTDKSGQVNVLFDDAGLGNIQNSIALFTNDSLRLGIAAREVYFTWTAQADTSADIYLYPDIEIVAGTTKTQIVGSVNVQNTAAAPLYSRYPIPSSIVTRTCAGAAGTATYTIPAGFYAVVRAAVVAQNANGSAGVSANTVAFCIAYSQASNTASSSAYAVLPAGTVVDLNSGAAAGGVANAVIELYPTT